MNVTVQIDEVGQQRVDPAPTPPRPPRHPQPRRFPLATRIVLGILAIPLVLIGVLYIVLLVHPIPLPIVRDQAQAAVLRSLPAGSSLRLGDMRLALEGAAWPVIRFSPVVYSDSRTGAQVGMKALEIGFSPLRALIGQPGATITIVEPHIQVTQDLLGPRLSSFTITEDRAGGPATVKVNQGAEPVPSVVISDKGVNVVGDLPAGGRQALRSDNDWLIYNLAATERGLAEMAAQAAAGRFSKLVIRDGVLDMNDAVYGLLRQFKDIRLSVRTTPGERRTVAEFSASLGGRVMRGSATRSVGPDGTIHLDAAVSNMDFASVLPFIDDPDAMMAIRGGGALSLHVNFDGKSHAVEASTFDVDLTGTDLRVEDDYFPIATPVVTIDWDPETGIFQLPGSQLRIGASTATIAGVFRLGLDPKYGPIAGISVKATDVSFEPGDMAAPARPFDEIDFSGWSAPLYGALGIDRLEARKADGAHVLTSGRIDMLRQGIGFDLDITGSGVSADDLKRLWPYFISRDTRDWFVDNISAGTIASARMHFAYPVGSLPRRGEVKPVPKGGISIDMVGTGVTVRALDTMAPVTIAGKTTLKVRDGKITASGEGATVPTDAGSIALANPAVVIQTGTTGRRSIEISGDINSAFPALVALARQQQPQALKAGTLPVDPAGLEGKVLLRLVATLNLDPDGKLSGFDYALNGNVSDFGSASPIAEHRISDGQLAFTASQAGYHIAGRADVDGMPAELAVDGGPDFKPHLLVTSTIDVKDLAAMGFDASPFLSGKVRFVARPMEDGTIQMAVDIKDAGLTIKDLGISKPPGVAGSLEAAVRQTDKTTELSQISLHFGDVDLEGGLVYDDEKGLQSASFTKFALSPGDDAQLSLRPIEGGYAVQIRGNQLDLKPMLHRFFGLGEDSVGAVASTQFDQTLALDIELKRALGFYKTTAFNFDLDMAVKGNDLQKVSLQAQLGDDKTVSVTTNPAPNGRSITAAFNDFGSLLRLIGVYPRVVGGGGSLVINTNTATNISTGEFQLHDFALIDEDKVAEILGSHRDSRALIARGNKLEFTSGTLDFVRRPDRIEVSNGMLAGDMVGGTMHGFIYTTRRQYDLVGTYVPFFGLNNVFQKLPILGPILGGREGEGLIGVTFAVRGPLDHPEFQINPASLLVPGAFRGLFEYRARELPPAGSQAKGN